jgi:peptidoglycan/LPS O-acetylase OafA/YrhL
MSPSSPSQASEAEFSPAEDPRPGEFSSVDDLRPGGDDRIRLRRFMPEIDSVRAYGFVFVLLSHIFYEKFPPGWIGVDAFFVLSGFLITRILLKARGKDGAVKNFYLRRIVRVFPIYYGTLVFIFYIWPNLTSDPAASYPAWQHKWFFAYLQNLRLRLVMEPTHTTYLGHTWSLAIEEQYYLLWPWFVLMVKPRTLLKILTAVILLSPVLRFLIYRDAQGALPAVTTWLYGWNDELTISLYERFSMLQGRTSWWIYKNTFTRLDGIAMGSLLAVVIHQGWIGFRNHRRLSILLAWTMLPGSLALILYTGFFPSVQFPPWWIVTFIYTTVGLGFTGMIGVLVYTRQPILQFVCGNRLVGFVGKISYGLYVYHFPLELMMEPRYAAFREANGGPLLFLHEDRVAFVILTFGIAIASWHLIERPMLKVKDRFV